MPMKFELIDIVLSLGIVQGLFLAVALTRIKDQNKNANRVLVQILLVTAFVLTGRMIIVHQFALQIFKWLSFTDSIIFLFGPLTYLYVRRLIIKSDTKYKLPWWHYLPAFIYAGIFIYLNVIDEATRLRLYQQGYIYWIFNAFEAVGLSANLIYLAKNFSLLNRYRKEEKRRLSNPQDFHRFLFLYLSTITVCMLFWLFSYMNAYYFRNTSGIISYDSIWVAIPFFIYIVGYYSLRQPELFRIVKQEKLKVQHKRLGSAETIQLKTSLETLLRDKQVYLDNELTLGGLSKLLEASSNDVSWLLNNEYKASFYDFINEYRVKEFLARIHANDHAHQTLLAIAMDVGFNSKSTFNKAFKTQVGVTPSEYIKNLKSRSQVA